MKAFVITVDPNNLKLSFMNGNFYLKDTKVKIAFDNSFLSRAEAVDYLNHLKEVSSKDLRLIESKLAQYTSIDHLLDDTDSKYAEYKSAYPRLKEKHDLYKSMNVFEVEIEANIKARFEINLNLVKKS